MSISYSAITNFGKVTLPSVDTWGTNMEILRDPPKSLHTRRIDKVGQTSDITTMIDDAGSRVCEGILQYSRGVNPMVSVEYNNSKSMSGKGLQAGGDKQAFLPYRVNRDGAFRPPIQTQYNLLPLSRQPRVWTSSFTNKAFPDYARQATERDDVGKTKDIKSSVLKTSARPTAVYKIQTPLEKPYEVKYMIQPSLKTSAHSGIRTMDRTSQHVLEPTKEINKNMSHTFAQSNMQDIRYVNNSEFSTDKYIQDSHVYSVDTTKGSNHIQLGSIDDFVDMGDVHTKNSILVDYNTPLRGNEKNEYMHDDLFQERNLPYYAADSNARGNNNKVTYIHEDIVLDRAIPYHSAESNVNGDKKISYIHEDIQLERNIPEYNVNSKMRGNDKVTYIHDDLELNRVLPEYSTNAVKTQQGIQKTLKPEYIRELQHNVPNVKDVYMNKGGQGESNKSSTRIQLADNLQAGSYHVRGSIPNQNRTSNIKENFETDKAKMNKMVIDQHMDRFSSIAPFDTRFK